MTKLQGGPGHGRATRYCCVVPQMRSLYVGDAPPSMGSESVLLPVGVTPVGIFTLTATSHSQRLRRREQGVGHTNERNIRRGPPRCGAPARGCPPPMRAVVAGSAGAMATAAFAASTGAPLRIAASRAAALSAAAAKTVSVRRAAGVCGRRQLRWPSARASQPPHALAAAATRAPSPPTLLLLLLVVVTAASAFRADAAAAVAVVATTMLLTLRRGGIDVRRRRRGQDVECHSGASSMSRRLSVYTPAMSTQRASRSHHPRPIHR